MYSYTPFTILLVINFLLIKLIRQKKLPTSHAESANRQKSRKNATSRTIIIVTFLYIILTGPEAVGSFFLPQILALPYGQAIMFLFDEICFTYHAFSFFILFFSNSRFSTELKNIFIKNTKRLNPSFSRKTQVKQTSFIV